MPKFLQPTQIEAHVNRLTAIKTQLQTYAEQDGRANEAIPSIDSVIATLTQEPFEPVAVNEGADVEGDADADADNATVDESYGVVTRVEDADDKSFE